MAKTRQLSEDEQKARQTRYGGMTRREFNAKHQRPRREAARSGSFEVVVIFDGNPVPQTAPFPNESAALARFDRLMSNPDVLNLKVVENKTVYDASGKAVGLRQVALYSFQRGGSQEFANSKRETLWRRKGGNSSFTNKQIHASPALLKASFAGELEIAKTVYYDGQAWWERRV